MNKEEILEHLRTSDTRISMRYMVATSSRDENGHGKGPTLSQPNIKFLQEMRKYHFPIEIFL